MRLIDFHQHLQNNNVEFCFRKEDMLHDVFRHSVSKLEVTIPKEDEEVPDEFVQMCCSLLKIEGVDGTPFNPTGTPGIIKTQQFRPDSN